MEARQGKKEVSKIQTANCFVGGANFNSSNEEILVGAASYFSENSRQGENNMQVETSEKYVCGSCGRTFEFVTWISYREYPGASSQQDPVSPCCNSHYGEVE